MAFSSTSLDRFVKAESPVHALDARVKLVLAFAAILALGLLPAGAWGGVLAIALLIWWAVLQSRVGLGLILRRAFVALPFALAAVTLVFSRPGEALFVLPLGPWRLTATDAGLTAFAGVVVKSWLSVQAALLLTATTPFAEVLQGLRSLRLPRVIVATLSFAYRYLFVMVDEAQRMLRARECRAAEAPGRPAGGTIRWRAAVVGRMVGTLFLRSYERSERIYVAMLSRGFDGEIRSLRGRPLGSAEQGLLLVGCAALAGIVLLAYVL
jgi:cobalt/nickel transport system permease protein